LQKSMDVNELQMRIKIHGLMLCLEKYVELANLGGEVHRVQMALLLERLSHCHLALFDFELASRLMDEALVMHAPCNI
jgi:hypothetical protein